MMRSRTIASAAALVTIVTLSGLASGCSQLDPQDETQAAASVPATAPILETKAWGVVDGLLSVVVVNTSDRTLRYAEGVVRAVDADGQVVSTSLGRHDSGCCTVVNLAPDEEYGLYLDLGDDLDGVDDVTVDFRNISWVAAGTPAPTTEVTTTSHGVDNEDSGAVVDATLTSPSPVVQVGVQAFLTDADGKFLAVVSGRWTCLAAGNNRIRMQLFRPVPEGAKVEAVVAHPLDDTTAGTPPPTCDDSGRR